MEISKLFEILATYLDFAIDFLLLHGLDKRARLGAIDPQLVQFFVAGILIAYLIASIKRMPGYEARIPSGIPTTTSDATHAIASRDLPTTKENDKKENSGLASEGPEMAGFILLQILGAFAVHGLLLLYHRVVGAANIGNVKDTLNAVFAVYAVYNPINAVLKQLQRAGNTMVWSSPNLAIKTVGEIILIGVSLGYFATLYYWIYALAAVHRTSRSYMLPPLGVLALLGIVIVVGVILYHRPARPKAQDRSAA